VFSLNKKLCRFFSVVSATVLLLPFNLLGCAGHKESGIYGKPVLPASAADVLKQYKLIAEHQLYLHDDFYADEVLKELFGSGEEFRIVRNSCPWSGRADIYRFARFFPPPSTSLNPGIYISAVEYGASCDKSVTPLPNTLGRIDLNVQGTTAGLDFKSVTDVFGANWMEDKPAELNLYNSIVREPWNPPPPKATAYMGNSIIKYFTPTSITYLTFASDGNLWLIQTTPPVATPQDPVKPAIK